VDTIVPIYYISLGYDGQSSPTESRMMGPDRVSDSEIVSTFGRGRIKGKVRIIQRNTESAQREPVEGTQNFVPRGYVNYKK